MKYEDGLICPKCGCDNLHQNEVSVFWRKQEDSAECASIGSSVLQTNYFVDPGRNPSPRRDGLLIKFYCEQCDADPELAIYQHKGTTYIKWHTIRMPVVS